MASNVLCPYICGPLTELIAEEQSIIKNLYTQLGDITADFGPRAFVPHEHYDPVANANFEPSDVDQAEREQVCTRTSLLVVIAVAPSWGGGIEVEMANNSDVPVIIFCNKEQLKNRKVSRLLRGNPAVKEVIPYDDLQEVPELLRSYMANNINK